MIIKAGSYVGDANDGRAISTNCEPDVFFVSEQDFSDWGASAVHASCRGMGDAAKSLEGSAAYVTNVIQSFTSTGVTVGTAQASNASGATYYWWAIEFEGDGEVGTYSGNGVDNRDISLAVLTAEEPDLVMVFGNVANVAVWRSNVHGAGLSQPFSSLVTSTANLIQAFGTGTFQVGTSTTVNENTTTYYYVAMKEVSGQMEIVDFTGDGADGRDLTGAGFNPDLAFIQRRTSSAVTMAFRHPLHSGDQSWATNGSVSDVSGANIIQAFITDGVDLGTNTRVNTNTGVYTAIFMKTTTAAGSGGARSYYAHMVGGTR